MTWSADGFGRDRNSLASRARRHRRHGLVAALAVPALVFHSRGDASVPFEYGRMLAHAIPNAQFVPLESRNHLILSHEPV